MESVISHSCFVHRLHKWHELEVDLSAELDNIMGFLMVYVCFHGFKAHKLLHHSKIIPVWFKVVVFDLLRGSILGKYFFLMKLSKRCAFKHPSFPDYCVLSL